MPKPGTRTRRYTACTHCKGRKVKCDAHVLHPCSNCEKLGYQCTIANDRRTNRPSNEDVQALKDRIKQLEAYISTMNQTAVIDDYRSDEDEHQTVYARTTEDSEKYPKPRTFRTLYQREASRESGVYGSTSILDTMEKERYNGDNYDDNDDDEEIDGPIIILRLNVINKDEKIIKLVKIFFQCNYPDLNIFIPRETFLIEFYHPRRNGKSMYCSIELIYAICSIGAMIYKDKKQSLEYFKICRKLALGKLNQNHANSFATMQTFLLLSSYEFLRNNFTSCWILSGIGLRIGFDIGFDKTFKDNYKISILFKSRIYWGCFIYDYFISLVFGRPTIMKVNDSTIMESERVPDLEWIKEFNFAKRDDIIDVSNPLKSIVRLIVISEEEIRKIVMLKGMEGRGDELEKELRNFTEKVGRWRDELPTGLQWTSVVEQSPLMVHVYYYYVVVLSVWKGFVVELEWIRTVCVAHAREVVCGADGSDGSGGGAASVLGRVARAVAVQVLDVASARDGKAAGHRGGGPHRDGPLLCDPSAQDVLPPLETVATPAHWDDLADFAVWETWMAEL